MRLEIGLLELLLNSVLNHRRQTLITETQHQGKFHLPKLIRRELENLLRNLQDQTFLRTLSKKKMVITLSTQMISISDMLKWVKEEPRLDLKAQMKIVLHLVQIIPSHNSQSISKNKSQQKKCLSLSSNLTDQFWLQ